MSVAEYVDGVDRLLTRAHGLFPAGGVGGGAVPAGGGGGSVPGAPAGGSGLTAGAGLAGGVYQRAQSAVAGLDAGAGEAAAEAAAIGAQGYTGSGVIRDQARAQAAAIAPMANSAAGMRLMVSTMDQHVQAMQQQVSTTSAQNQGVATRLRQVAASYRSQTDLPSSRGDAKDSPPALPLDSQTWKPGDKRHLPYVAGPGGVGPPNYGDAPPWVEIGSGSGNFVRSDEVPGLKVLAPGELGPATVSDSHGNPDPYIQLGPNTGAWVPKSDFPGAIFMPPDSTELPPYGYDEYLPHSGIFVWHGDLVPEPYNPGGPGLPPQTHPAGH
ncbi:MAG: hypothetical protein WCF69_15975 [Mycobacterium sp.]